MQPKPDYVILTINGEDFGYNVENEACANFFTGKRGQTFAIQAEGSRDDAKIVFVGAPASQMQPPPAQPAQRYDSNPPGRPAVDQTCVHLNHPKRLLLWCRLWCGGRVCCWKFNLDDERDGERLARR